jgi:hypothetical protein
LDEDWIGDCRIDGSNAGLGLILVEELGFRPLVTNTSDR